MSPDALLRQARRSIEQAGAENNEAAWRSAIHLAYYATYHLAARQLGADPANRKDSHHRQLHERIAGAKGNMVLEAAAKVIVSLYGERVRADYRLNDPVSRTDAEIVVARAEQVFASIP